MYGIVQRGARGPHTVAYDFYPYLYGHGGGIFKDQAAGDYSVTLNNAEGRAALDYYIRLAQEAGHPKTAALDQAEVIQTMVTGKAAHIMMVIAAWSQMDDPTKSASSTRSSSPPPPHAAGVPTGAGPRPLARRRRAERARTTASAARSSSCAGSRRKDAQIATAKAGGIPVNAAAYRDPIAEERKLSAG